MHATDHLARIVERADLAIPVILLVQGVVITGRMVPRRNYTQWFYQSIGSAVGQNPDDIELANAALSASQTDVPDDATFDELCIQSAHMRNPSGEDIRVPYLIVQAATIGAFTAGEQVTG